ncbi:MAG: hypothetical protein L0H41_13560 [Microlunatus sp.]|nr:hypothetical protein [Microlunatus sp.]
MSQARTVHPSRRRLAAYLTALALALTLAGGTSLGPPAYADAVIQITGPTSPVPVDTPYIYTVTVPTLNGFYGVIVDLTGSAATFTDASATDPFLFCSVSGTNAQCLDLAANTTVVQVTLTVLPTTPGTVTASAQAIKPPTSPSEPTAPPQPSALPLSRSPGSSSRWTTRRRSTP